VYEYDDFRIGVLEIHSAKMAVLNRLRTHEHAIAGRIDRRRTKELYKAVGRSGVRACVGCQNIHTDVCDIARSIE
jgi:hypothetical protein